MKGELQGDIQEKPSWAHLEQMFRDYIEGNPAQAPAGLSDDLGNNPDGSRIAAGRDTNRHTWMHSESAGE